MCKDDLIHELKNEIDLYLTIKLKDFGNKMYDQGQKDILKAEMSKIKELRTDLALLRMIDHNRKIELEEIKTKIKQDAINN